MASKIRLDFNALPTFESSPFFYTLNRTTDARLRTLKATYARCNAALRFMSNIGASADHLHVRAEEVDGMHLAYLRASLMEYVGMEEALQIDLGRGQSALRISETRNAMLVVLRELRNVQIHLVRSDLVSSKRSAVSRFDGQEQEHEITTHCIPKSDLARLIDGRTASYCHRDDLSRAVEWLAEAQEHWGISEVVMRGIWAYADAIVERHVPAET